MKLFCFSVLLHFGLLLEPQPCDFLGMRLQHGCQGDDSSKADESGFRPARALSRWRHMKVLKSFLAYRRRFGDMCEEKMLNPKGTGGELVMKMIDDANNMMVVSMLWLQ